MNPSEPIRSGNERAPTDPSSFSSSAFTPSHCAPQFISPPLSSYASSASSSPASLRQTPSSRKTGEQRRRGLGQRWRDQLASWNQGWRGECWRAGGIRGDTRLQPPLHLEGANNLGTNSTPSAWKIAPNACRPPYRAHHECMNLQLGMWGCYPHRDESTLGNKRQVPIHRRHGPSSSSSSAPSYRAIPRSHRKPQIHTPLLFLPFFHRFCFYSVASPPDPISLPQCPAEVPNAFLPHHHRKRQSDEGHGRSGINDEGGSLAKPIKLALKFSDRAEGLHQLEPDEAGWPLWSDFHNFGAQQLSKALQVFLLVRNAEAR
ncbi:hypothetical protein BDK51DRAFT_51197 [Blyttiomyces helicus]|uniref:Uncharacterized protein n=1 Tax=Blyttiomyces helicus TaxID=388810 RepID=A0A4P9W8J9_9FUNG|nr:hypothetical protein BDK51DRAFT_51197 [Blyttiomyces helicus]|eukprot:RKO88861.1 hypothetical protein BDK51DRAFT_51197 [Blyttiomyces helicus]